MLHKIMNLRSKPVALARLLRTSDADFKAYMGTYQTLFSNLAPMQRAGTVDEVASVVTFLASDSSTYMTAASRP